MLSARKIFTLAAAAALLSVLALGLGSPIYAEDLSDNETCLECHADHPRTRTAHRCTTPKAVFLLKITRCGPVSIATTT